ncbi:MAG TPA: helix-turn-helix domain-containing protein [Chitinispirillaceae bacterium]|nr:helix-turn-helix domain-containing protein [Chitinispirillaceae bacterium]
MNFQIIQPAGFLKNYIKNYCFMESSRCESDMMERVIPTENIQLMFHYRNPFIVYHPDTSITKQPRSIISGLSNSFLDVTTNGEAGVVFISFYPTSACHFFRFPLSEIENQNLDLAEILGPEVRLVEELLYFATSLKEKVSVIENFLIKRYSPVHSHDSQLIWKAIEIIKMSNVPLNIAALSESLSTTTKTLERKFAQYLGKTPKQLIKLLRFQRVLHDFSCNKNFNLTEHAYNNGYFDQAHFIRDFKNFAGYTPGEFITKYPDFDINSASC